MKFIVNTVLAVSSIVALGQESAHTVQYHSQDIVAIRAKVKYTTLIEVPPSEKIMEAATGDKDFWIVDVVGNFCFVHPAKQGISSNLNLITDKGNIYSFTLQDMACYRRILYCIIELRQERDVRWIFLFPAYRPPDCLLNRHRFLVPQFLADTRRTRRPMLRGVARLLQMPRRVLNRQDDIVPIPRIAAAILRAHSSSLNDGSSHTL